MLFCYITDRSQFPGDEETRRRALLAKIAEATRAGVQLIQLREKDLSIRDLESLARSAIEVTAENAPAGGIGPHLLVNSRIDVGFAVGAAGVHLRSDDISVQDARAIWERASRSSASRVPVVGVSCHRPAEVARAAASGADFAVFAPVFGKHNVPSIPAAGLGTLRDACQHKIRVLALGGITLHNAGSCIEAGASGIAGIRLFQENDVSEIVAKLGR